MSPKMSIKSFKDPKRCLCENLEHLTVVQVFLGPEAFQKSYGNPKKTSQSYLRNSETSKIYPKLVPKLIVVLSKLHCKAIVALILGPELSPKLVQFLESCWGRI